MHTIDPTSIKKTEITISSESTSISQSKNDPLSGSLQEFKKEVLQIIDNRLKPKSFKKQSNRITTSPISTSSTSIKRENKFTENGSPICNFCGIVGHRWRDCRRRLRQISS